MLLIGGGALAAGTCTQAPPDATGVDVRWGWSPQSPRVGLITLSLDITEANTPVRDAAVQVHALMTHPGMVPVVTMAEEIAPGRYEATLELTMAGDWVLLAEGVLADGRLLRGETRLSGVLPP